MRNVIFAINVSLDGCCDHTKFGGSEEILEYFTEFFQNIDLIVYGRKTYELMIPYWPDVINDESSTEAEIRYAKKFDAMNKIVFSKTLNSVEDKNTRLIHSNLAEEISKLKQEEGKSISVGGADLPSQLVEHGLVDEFLIIIHPVIVGEGRRLFDGANLQENLNLKLVSSKVFKSGCVALHYLKQ